MHTVLIQSFVASAPVAQTILQGWESRSSFYTWLLANSSLYYSRVAVSSRRTSTNRSWQGSIHLWEIYSDFTDHQLVLFQLVEDQWLDERATVNRERWIWD